MAKGTKDDQWKLKTPSLTSDIVLWRDPDATPPTLMCIASGTELRYQLRIIDDMHAMLKKHGDGWSWATPTSRSPPRRAPSRLGAGTRTTRSAGGTAATVSRGGVRGRRRRSSGHPGRGGLTTRPR